MEKEKKSTVNSQGNKSDLLYISQKQTKRKTLLSLINLFIEANIRRYSSSTLRKKKKKSQKLIVSLNTLSFKEYLFLLCSALYLFLRLLFRLFVYEKKNLVSFCKHLLLVEISMRGEVERKKARRRKKKNVCSEQQMNITDQILVYCFYAMYYH